MPVSRQRCDKLCIICLHLKHFKYIKMKVSVMILKTQITNKQQLHNDTKKIITKLFMHILFNLKTELILLIFLSNSLLKK